MRSNRPNGEVIRYKIHKSLKLYSKWWALFYWQGISDPCYGYTHDAKGQDPERVRWEMTQYNIQDMNTIESGDGEEATSSSRRRQDVKSFYCHTPRRYYPWKIDPGILESGISLLYPYGTWRPVSRRREPARLSDTIHLVPSPKRAIMAEPIGWWAKRLDRQIRIYLKIGPYVQRLIQS